MKVTYIDHMGSDLSVANAARVSFDKESELEFAVLSPKDAKLIEYLSREGHWSPFAHAFASFRIKAPIFVARQLGKHQVGLSWNEVSRRYVDSAPETYNPGKKGWRLKADNVKQGSSEAFYSGNISRPNQRQRSYASLVRQCINHYNWMLEQGICPEQARMVLPQSMMTEWIWSGSLHAFARVCNLRLDSHTQKETQFIAGEISTHMANYFPVSWNALMEA